MLTFPHSIVKTALAERLALLVDGESVQLWLVHANRLARDALRIVDQKLHRERRAKEAAIQCFGLGKERRETGIFLVGGDVDVLAARAVVLHDVSSFPKKGRERSPWLIRQSNLLVS